jgi:hypothetical protein
MSIARDERCIEAEESMVDVIDGTAPASVVEHVADCDRCRDLKYEAEQTAAAMASAGADFQPTEGFAERMLALVLEARPDGPQPSLSTSSILPKSTQVPMSGAQPARISRTEAGEPVAPSHGPDHRLGADGARAADPGSRAGQQRDDHHRVADDAR